MLVQLKFPRKIGGKFYGKGEHKLPLALAEDWFVKALVRDGDLTMLPEADEEPAPEPKKKKTPAQPQKKG